jgi:hypothetical protein
MATVGSKKLVLNAPFVVEKVRLSEITPGALYTYSLANRTGVAPDFAASNAVVRATSGDPVFVSIESHNSTNHTVDLRLDTVSGGDLEGAEVDVLLFFFAQASGGIGG